MGMVRTLFGRQEFKEPKEPYNPNNEPIVVPYHLDLITGARSSTLLSVAAFTLMLTIVMYAVLNLIFGCVVQLSSLCLSLLSSKIAVDF